MKPSVYNVPIEIGGRKLIFNTLTRSLLKVTTAIEDVLCGKADDADEQEVLKQNGLIVEDSFDEVAYVENQCFKNRFSSSHIFLLFLRHSYGVTTVSPAAQRPSFFSFAADSAAA